MLPGVSLVVVIIIASDAAVVTVTLDIFDGFAVNQGSSKYLEGPHSMSKR